METQICLQDSPGMGWLLAQAMAVHVNNMLRGLMSSFTIQSLLKALLIFMAGAQITW